MSHDDVLSVYAQPECFWTTFTTFVGERMVAAIKFVTPAFRISKIIDTFL